MRGLLDYSLLVSVEATDKVFDAQSIVKERRISQTSGKVLPLRESRHVNAHQVNVHQDLGGLHRLHEDIRGE